MRKDLRAVNSQHKLAQWAGRVSACRSSGQKVREWCKENGICEQTYYKWQRKVFEMTREEVQFAEVTPIETVGRGEVAVTVRIGGAEADIYTGADGGVVEAVLRVLKSC